MLPLRTDIRYVAADGKLTQAGVEAIQGQIDGQGTSVSSLSSDVTALTTRVTTLEGYRRSVLLATKTASASATLDFTEFNSTLYSRYYFEFDEVKPATDIVGLAARTSTDGGATYTSSAASYMGSAWGHAQPGSASTAGTATLGYVTRASVGNAAGEFGVTGHMWLLFADDSGKRTRAICQTSYEQESSWVETGHASWVRQAAETNNAVRFLFSSGNITSGTIRMYGLT